MSDRVSRLQKILNTPMKSQMQAEQLAKDDLIVDTAL